VTERHPYAYDAGGELRAAAELDPATTATMVWLTDDQVAMLGGPGGSCTGTCNVVAQRTGPVLSYRYHQPRGTP
jgi:hypothetical protein